jgi:hypothetical protein
MGSSQTALLTTGFHEYVKQKFVYDESGRMIAVYEARSEAKHGEPALLTTYQYQGASNRVDVMKESESVWDGAWG